MWFSTFKAAITRSLIIAIIGVFTFAAPVDHLLKPQYAQALHVTNTEVACVSTTCITNMVSNVNTFAQKLADNLNNLTFEGILYQLGNMIISRMIRSVTQWVNSGFEGSPAFVTDLEGFLIDILDQAVGEFINSSELGFLCSPFQLDVRIALSVQYQNLRSEHGSPQCTLSSITGNVENFLSGTFSEGGWQGWFHLTQGTHNDPTRAFLESRSRMGVVIEQNRERELITLAANDFFLDVEVCDVIEGVGLSSREHCQTVTPGTVIEEQLNKTLGLPADRLVVADEINELISALMQQLSTQLLSGVNGLLGLGGSSSFGNNNFGSSGSLSYLDALVEENIDSDISNSEDAFIDAESNQIQYENLMQAMLDDITDLENDIESARSTYGSCINTNLTGVLSNRKDTAVESIAAVDTALILIDAYQAEYDNAGSIEERVDILDEFIELRIGSVRPNSELFDRILDNNFLSDPGSITMFNELDISLAEIDMRVQFPQDLGEGRDRLQQNIQQCQVQSNDDAPRGSDGESGRDD